MVALRSQENWRWGGASRDTTVFGALEEGLLLPDGILLDSIVQQPYFFPQGVGFMGQFIIHRFQIGVGGQPMGKTWRISASAIQKKWMNISGNIPGMINIDKPKPILKTQNRLFHMLIQTGRPR